MVLFLWLQLNCFQYDVLFPQLKKDYAYDDVYDDGDDDVLLIYDVFFVYEAFRLRNLSHFL